MNHHSTNPNPQTNHFFPSNPGCLVCIIILASLILGACTISKSMENYFTKEKNSANSYPQYIADFQSKDYAPDLFEETDVYLSHELQFRIEFYLQQFAVEEDAIILKNHRDSLRRAGKPAVPFLLDALQNETKPAVRREIIKTLGEMGFQEAIEGVLPGLQDENYEIRAATIKAIESIKSQRANEEIVKALHDGHPIVRAAAARAVGDLTINKSISGLRRLLQDSNPMVRGAAAASLGKLRSYSSIDAIRPLLNDGSRDVRQRAIQSLRSLGVTGLAEVALPESSNDEDEENTNKNESGGYDVFSSNRSSAPYTPPPRRQTNPEDDLAALGLDYK